MGFKGRVAQFVFFAFFLLSTTFGLSTCIVANIVQDSLESSRAFEKALKEIDRENRHFFKSIERSTRDFWPTLVSMA